MTERNKDREKTYTPPNLEEVALIMSQLVAMYPLCFIKTLDQNNQPILYLTPVEASGYELDPPRTIITVSGIYSITTEKNGVPNLHYPPTDVLLPIVLGQEVADADFGTTINLGDQLDGYGYIYVTKLPFDGPGASSIHEDILATEKILQKSQKASGEQPINSEKCRNIFKKCF